MLHFYTIQCSMDSREYLYINFMTEYYIINKIIMFIYLHLKKMAYQNYK